MSEFKPVSPLLDGFVIGELISDHHGVRCYPAIHESTGEQFIVKVISIPASQIQVDALFLAGAFSSRDQAMSYFEETAKGILSEAEILDQLAQLEGFLPYSGIHHSEMDTGTGYEVCLVSPYKRSLRKQMQKSPMTHLGAVNLGLDLCAALATSRRAGYLYSDLKPSNIFLTPTKGWRIGDLGFIPLASLKYASLPEKYHSEYTAPEITDEMSELNDTIDVYALGLVLYQIYNNGELPPEAIHRSEPLPPPPYADYELAEIILKACAVTPGERWSNPAKMGQALIDYMQRNTINDTPIIPPSVGYPMETDEADETDFLSEEENEAALVEMVNDLPDEEAPQLPLVDSSLCADEAQSTSDETSVVEEETQAAPDSATTEETPPVADDISSIEDDPTIPDDLTSSVEDTNVSSDEDPLSFDEEFSFIDDAQTDETAPSEENAEELEDVLVTLEVTEMLAQADELISHELPDPVVAPDPIDIPFPAPIILDIDDTCDDIDDIIPSALTAKKVAPADEKNDNPDPEVSEDLSEGASGNTDSESQDDPLLSNEIAEEEGAPIRDRSKKKPKSKINIKLICGLAAALALLIAIVLGTAFLYNRYYLQVIDSIEISGDLNSCTVSIQSEIADALLNVVCTDTYGNSRNSSVHQGIALFNDLTPNTQYRFVVNISGAHKLVGSTSGTFTTPQQTEIINFNAVTGAEDGSVILSFGVNGPDFENWTLQYTSPNGNTQTVTFSGHTVTVSGLDVGEEYTFSLRSEEDCYLTGMTQLDYTAQTVTYAHDLYLTDCENGSIGIAWTTPEGTGDCNWIVRCYNDKGFDKTITTTDTQTRFQVPTHDRGYTVDVTAEGMTSKATLFITANPITITEIGVPIISDDTLKFYWNFLGNSPATGWKLSYSIDHTAAITLNCETSIASLPYYPGSHYEITILPADETTCLSKPFSYNAPEAKVFDQYRVTAADMNFKMCLTPDEEDWDRHDLDNDDYRTSFTVGEKASFVIKQTADRKKSTDEVRITYIIRERDGGPISLDTENIVWNDMWTGRYCELDIPRMPGVAGEYTITIYFNGCLAASQNFTIT